MVGLGLVDCCCNGSNIPFAPCLPGSFGLNMFCVCVFSHGLFGLVIYTPLPPPHTLPWDFYYICRFLTCPTLYHHLGPLPPFSPALPLYAFGGTPTPFYLAPLTHTFTPPLILPPTTYHHHHTHTTHSLGPYSLVGSVCLPHPHACLFFPPRTVPYLPHYVCNLVGSPLGPACIACYLHGFICLPSSLPHVFATTYTVYLYLFPFPLPFGCCCPLVPHHLAFTFPLGHMCRTFDTTHRGSLPHTTFLPPSYIPFYLPTTTIPPWFTILGTLTPFPLPIPIVGQYHHVACMPFAFSYCLAALDWFLLTQFGYLLGQLFLLPHTVVGSPDCPIPLVSPHTVIHSPHIFWVLTF